MPGDIPWPYWPPQPLMFLWSNTPGHYCYRYDDDGKTILRECKAHCQCPCHSLNLGGRG